MAMPSKLHGFALTVVASLVATGVQLVVAQSLGEVARQEEARRKEIKQPGKVYTNKDLVPVPNAISQEASKPQVTSAAGEKDGDKAAGPGGSDARSANGKGADGKDQGGVKDQAYWSGRMKELGTQLERDQAFAEALQSRINGLTADFTARDDPAQRAVIGRDRQKALDELDRVRKAIEADKKAVADLQEDARRAAIPPGWLR